MSTDNLLKVDNQQLKLIEELDLSCVLRKLILPVEEGGYGWPEENATDAIMEYKKFLNQVYLQELSQTNNPKSTPDAVVDIVWHTHILFTRKYHDDCQNIFGKYIHHEPKI